MTLYLVADVRQFERKEAITEAVGRDVVSLGGRLASSTDAVNHGRPVVGRRGNNELI